MARWVSEEAPARSSLRAQLLRKFARRVERDRTLPFRDGHAAAVVKDLKAGRAVVLPGWELYRFDVPQVRRGTHAFYRVDRTGAVVEVVPVRANGEITGWEPAVHNTRGNTMTRTTPLRATRTTRGA